jgi:hypothetical protein
MRDSRYDIFFEPVKIGPQIGRRLRTDNGTIAKQRPFLALLRLGTTSGFSPQSAPKRTLNNCSSSISIYE